MTLSRVVTVIVQLLIASFVVGLVLTFLDIEPRELVSDIPRSVRNVVDFLVGILEWAWPYIAVGAVIVVPVWLVVMVLRFFRRR